MKIIYKRSDIKDKVKALKANGLTIGFVPTMGALHQGHLSLIKEAKLQNDIVVCSIFVNPIQFNNQQDLEKYPIDYESDLKKLENLDCDLVFMPDVEEMYPEPPTQKYDFGFLDKVMEGKFRPGHFNGVATVVHKFFDIIEPDKAYFGEKDFQQLTIIKRLVKDYNIPVEIVPCPIVRESDGLAMSSRNLRLTKEQRIQAPYIYQTLLKAKENYKKFSVIELKNWIKEEINKNSFMKLEYVEIVDMQTLHSVNNYNDIKNLIICIVVFLGEIRLIDNIKLFY